MAKRFLTKLSDELKDEYKLAEAVKLQSEKDWEGASDLAEDMRTYQVWVAGWNQAERTDTDRFNVEPNIKEPLAIRAGNCKRLLLVDRAILNRAQYFQRIDNGETPGPPGDMGKRWLDLDVEPGIFGWLLVFLKEHKWPTVKGEDAEEAYKALYKMARDFGVDSLIVALQRAGKEGPQELPP